MNLINVIGLETRYGFRTVELHEADITCLDFAVDVLVLSAFAGSYVPSPNTVIRALATTHGIDVAREADAPALDLRSALGVWVGAERTPSAPIGRLVGVEIRGTGFSLGEALDNVFASLLLIEAKGARIPTVALPLLGAGSQKLRPADVASELVSRARSYLERSTTTTRLAFVEIAAERAKLVSEAMDRLLGRERVVLPQQQLTSALRQDVEHRIRNVTGLFNGCEYQREEWLGLLQQEEVRSIEFGILARRLIELYLARFGQLAGPLATRIRATEVEGRVAPWICAYMHVLRQLGNEAAHENSFGSVRVPRVIAPADLTAGLFCVQRLLDAWPELDPQQ